MSFYFYKMKRIVLNMKKEKKIKNDISENILPPHNLNQHSNIINMLYLNE